MSGVKPYSSYRPSGKGWLGEVPEHWDVRRLGTTGRFFKGNGGTKADETEGGLPCVRYGDLYTRHEFFITESKACVAHHRAAAYTRIRYGDVLFAGSGETLEEIGKSAVNLISGSAVCGGDVIVFRPTIDLDAKFIGWSTDCRQAVSQKACMGRGITVMHIYSSELKRLLVPLPPLLEQTAIAHFLDHADRRIQRYIRAKQRLIELLEEKKQAIILQAVTGQIDVRTGQPYPAYKDSGVEWLGEVPEHWEVRPVKGATRILRGKFTHRPRNDPSLYGGPFPFVQTGDVARASKKIESYSQTLNEKGLAVSRKFPSGTLVMAIAANIGDVAVLDFEACFPDSVVGFVPNKGAARRDYLYCVFLAMKRELIREAPVNTQGNLNVDRLGSRRIPLPPYSEQILIDRYVGETTGNLKAIVDQSRRQIELLKEYRTRLIADVVTGKLDVREAAALLPDIDPLDSDDARDNPEAPTTMVPDPPDPALHPTHP